MHTVLKDRVRLDLGAGPHVIEADYFQARGPTALSLRLVGADGAAVGLHPPAPGWRPDGCSQASGPFAAHEQHFRALVFFGLAFLWLLAGAAWVFVGPLPARLRALAPPQRPPPPAANAFAPGLAHPQRGVRGLRAAGPGGHGPARGRAAPRHPPGQMGRVLVPPHHAARLLPGYGLPALRQGLHLLVPPVLLAGPAAALGRGASLVGHPDHRLAGRLGRLPGALPPGAQAFRALRRRVEPGLPGRLSLLLLSAGGLSLWRGALGGRGLLLVPAGGPRLVGRGAGGAGRAGLSPGRGGGHPAPFRVPAPRPAGR